jgi:endonuclease/exonuclease/phosphatase family metal-dependent hydrolase
VAWLSWLYVGAMIGLWLLLRTQADRWWPATLVTFGPRWIWALPLALLLPSAIAVQRRALVPLAIASLVLAGPLMDCCLPWDRWLTNDTGGPHIRILTCNVEGLQLDVDALRGVLDDGKPDIVAFQEWAERHAAVLLSDPAWHVHTGKGLCLGSRFPIRDVDSHPDEHGWRDVGVRHDVETPRGTLHVFNVHLSTPREGLEAVLARPWRGGAELEANTAMRARESDDIHQWVSRAESHVVIAGDFNMPVESLVYQQAWGQYRDSFTAAGLGLGHTKFTRWYGVRIDHILCGPGWSCRRCWVGPDVGSDHRPVLADLEWLAYPR